MAKQMKDSGIEWIGKIPESWAVGRVKNAYTSHKTIVGSDSDKFQRLALTLGGVVKRSKDDSTGLQPEAFCGYQILKTGELVFKLIDLENIQTSRVGLSPYEGIVSPAYIVLEKRTGTNAEYGELFFLSMWQRGIFNRMGDDGVRSSLNASDLLNIPYIMPPYDEQQRIADYLNNQCTYIDSVIEQTNASITEYKKLKQAIITEAVTKGVRGERPMKDSGIEWIGDIPVEWRVTQLRHCAAVKSGITLGKVYDKNIEHHELPYLRVANVQDGYVDVKDLAYLPVNREEIEKYRLHAGDVLMTEGGDRDKLGRGCVWDARIDPCLHQNHIFAVHTHETFLNPYFLEYLTASKVGRCYFDVTATKTTNLACTSSSKVLAFAIPLPSINEQGEIVAYLKGKCSTIDSLIAKKQESLAELESYKKSLIYEFVTGKKEVPTNEVNVVAVDPILLKALLYAKTHELLGKNCRGRIQIQKMLYLIESMNDLKIGSQYVRQKFGPLDVDLDKIESFMEQKRWLKTIQGSPTSYKKMDHYKEYRTEFSKYLAPYEAEIKRIVHFFENMNTSQAERFATLMAVWNDFILDGNANPSDEELIHEVITNWHPHKANYKYTTWQDTVNKMRTNGIIPHGYGLHTIFPVT